MNYINSDPWLNTDEKIDALKKENAFLQDEITEMQKFFDELSVPIIKRIVRQIEKKLRRFPPEASQFGGDSDLIFFEEVCVMTQEGSMDYYLLVEQTIEGICKDMVDDLNPNEKFILSHQSFNEGEDNDEMLVREFFDYANSYTNKKIKESLESRY